MRIKMIISRLLFAMTICFFSYSCGGEESSTTQAPVDKRTTKAPAKIPWPERPGKAAADKERAKKIQELIEKLDGDDAREAYDAVLKLSMFGDETAVEPLMDIAERESGMMRTAALQALGSIGDKRAFNLILDALNDDELSVRRNAASGLGNFRDESAIEPLIEALEDEDGWIRMNALGSLQKITNQDFPDYDAWRKWYSER